MGGGTPPHFAPNEGRILINFGSPNSPQITRNITVEIDPKRIKRRIEAKYLDISTDNIDDADANGVTTQADTITWDDSTSTIKGYIHIVDINDPTTYARFKITAAVTDASGYNKITVAHLASNNTFSAADTMLSFVFEGAQISGSLQPFPNLISILERYHERPPYKVALEKGGEYNLEWKTQT